MRNHEPHGQRLTTSVKHKGQYGAGVARLAITCNTDQKEARNIHSAYWKRNWAVKAVSDEQTIKTLANGEMWLLNPVNKFYYSLRNEKDVFSTLVQGTASFVFDVWVREVLKVKDQLTAQFHDEIVLCVKKGYRKAIEEVLDRTIQITNSALKLNRELSIGVQFGENYAQIH